MADSPAGRIVTVANQKGGVGKTTTAINLAACLGRDGLRVLLIDFDAQANATSGLGKRDEAETRNIYRAITGEQAIDDCVLETGCANLWLIGSTPDLAGAEAELIEVPGRYTVLRERLDRLTLSFDYTIIDCPPALSLLTVNALCAANRVLVPVQCEYYALEGLSQLIRTLNLVHKKINPKLVIDGFVLTMADSRTNLSQQVAGEVRRFFKDKVYETVIPRNVKLSEAPGFGKSVVDYDPHSSGAEAYCAFATEFRLRQNHAAPPTPLDEPGPMTGEQDRGRPREGRGEQENR
ncbi:MAG: ParA family protein [Verrucomicrobia bacterium]|nr:ParA family protein [Verrucomicrobiota bacterium]